MGLLLFHLHNVKGVWVTSYQALNWCSNRLEVLEVTIRSIKLDYPAEVNHRMKASNTNRKNVVCVQLHVQYSSLQSDICIHCGYVPFLLFFLQTEK